MLATHQPACHILRQCSNSTAASYRSQSRPDLAGDLAVSAYMNMLKTVSIQQHNHQHETITNYANTKSIANTDNLNKMTVSTSTPSKVITMDTTFFENQQQHHQDALNKQPSKDDEATYMGSESDPSDSERSLPLMTSDCEIPSSTSSTTSSSTGASRGSILRRKPEDEPLYVKKEPRWWGLDPPDLSSRKVVLVSNEEIEQRKEQLRSAVVELVHGPKSGLDIDVLNDAENDMEDEAQSNPKELNRQVTSSISFGEVSVREYKQMIGENPSVSQGPPVELSWEFKELRRATVEQYEQMKPTFTPLCDLVLSLTHRNMILARQYGVSLDEVERSQGISPTTAEREFSEAQAARKAELMEKKRLKKEKKAQGGFLKKMFKLGSKKTKKVSSPRDSLAAIRQTASNDSSTASGMVDC